MSDWKTLREFTRYEFGTLRKQKAKPMTKYGPEIEWNNRFSGKPPSNADERVWAEGAIENANGGWKAHLTLQEGSKIIGTMYGNTRTQANNAALDVTAYLNGYAGVPADLEEKWDEWMPHALAKWPEAESALIAARAAMGPLSPATETDRQWADKVQSDNGARAGGDVEGLATVVRMLRQALSKRAPDHSALRISGEYLRKHGLEGSLLRGADPACDNCGGSGQVLEIVQHGDGSGQDNYDTPNDCPKCDATGQASDEPSYDALKIIWGVVFGALQRAEKAGFLVLEDVDNPGLAIDEIRYRAERAESALAHMDAFVAVAERYPKIPSLYWTIDARGHCQWMRWTGVGWIALNSENERFSPPTHWSFYERPT